MTGYLYILLFAVLLSYNIIRSVYLFNKGQYTPYPFRKEKKGFPFIIKLAINLAILVGAYVFITSIKLLSIMLVIFLWYSFFLLICVSVLNYLSYMRIKDKNILFQTAIFNITIIIISAGIWKYITKIV